MFLIMSCGGGGGSDSSPAPTQGNTPTNQSPIGLWKGTTSENIEFATIVTQDKFYVITVSPFQRNLPSSVISGGWTVDGTGFTSQNAVELSLNNGIIPLTIRGNVSTEQTFSGTIDFGSLGSVTFTSNFDDDFDRNASISEIAGYSRGVSFTDSGYDNTIGVIEDDGGFSGVTYLGCTVSGQLTENNLGNFYDATLNSQCPNGASSNVGIAYYDENFNEIFLLGINNTQTNGVLYWGDIRQRSVTSSVSDIPAGSIEQLSKAEGFWQGSTADNRGATGLITDNGEGYVLYSGVSNNLISGVVITKLSNNSNGIESEYGIDFDIANATISPVDIQGTAIPGETLEATISYGSGIFNTVSMNYDINYQTVPRLSDITGAFTGTSIISTGAESVEVTIGANGQLSGISSSGCIVTGSVQPKDRGNVFDLSISFNGSPCLYEYQVFKGVLVKLADSGQIIAIAPNNELTDGVLFISDAPN